MNKLRTLLILSCLNIMSHVRADNDVIDSLMRCLDETIANKETFVVEKEARMDKLKGELRSVVSDEKRFLLLGNLLDECRSYNTDSALHIAEEKMAVARKMPERPDYMDDAVMNVADIYGMAGMYKEAMELMDGISADNLPDYLDPYYYHIYRTIYGLMADYSISNEKKMEYRKLTDRYRDSLLMVNDERSLPYILTKSDQFNANGEYDKAIDLLTDLYGRLKGDVHDVAIVAYTLSEAYRMKGDAEKEKEYLIISSIADIRSANREYISLRKLALMLYKEGDTSRTLKNPFLWILPCG